MLKSLMNLLLSKFCLKTEVTELNSPQVGSYIEVPYSSLPENPQAVVEKLYTSPFDGWVCLDDEPLDTGSYYSYVNSVGILSFIYAQGRRSVYAPIKKGQTIHVRTEATNNAILRVIRRVGSPPHNISPKGSVLCLRNLYSFLQRNFLLAKKNKLGVGLIQKLGITTLFTSMGSLQEHRFSIPHLRMELFNLLLEQIRKISSKSEDLYTILRPVLTRNTQKNGLLHIIELQKDALSNLLYSHSKQQTLTTSSLSHLTDLRLGGMSC